eukprot:gene6228-2846_t
MSLACRLGKSVKPLQSPFALLLLVVLAGSQVQAELISYVDDLVFQSEQLDNDFHLDSNIYLEEGELYVASIKNAFVTGVMGSVYDAQGRVYTEFTRNTRGLPMEKNELENLDCKPLKRLASTIQKYGHMYYHFLLEALPRLILLKPYLDENTKVLMFGAPYEAGWLEYLGIPLEAVEVYDPTLTYCADELIVASPATIITPAKEGYQLLRDHVGASKSLPEAERNVVIYSSRAGANDREVSNEAELLAQMHQVYPDLEIIKYTGAGMSVSGTVDLFRRARVVMGMHGAGLSHMVFCAPGTVVLEFLFMYDPPMMFWHASGALGFRYVMLPLAQSWWLQPSVYVETQDVIDAMAIALEATTGPPQAHVSHVLLACTAPLPDLSPASVVPRATSPPPLGLRTATPATRAAMPKMAWSA